MLNLMGMKIYNFTLTKFVYLDLSNIMKGHISQPMLGETGARRYTFLKYLFPAFMTGYILLLLDV